MRCSQLQGAKSGKLGKQRVGKNLNMAEEEIEKIEKKVVDGEGIC